MTVTVSIDAGSEMRTHIEIIPRGRYDSRLHAYEVFADGWPIGFIRHHNPNGTIRLVELALAKVQSTSRERLHERT
jgi:hypothetical protein